MNALRQPEERGYTPGEIVPSTGIYGVYHREHQQEVVALALLADQTFPQCEACGEDVRYLLEYAAPHILDDEDFQAENRRGPQPVSNKDN